MIYFKRRFAMRITALLKGAVNGLYASLKRFPAAIGFAAAAAILLMILHHNSGRFGSDLQTFFTRMIMVAALGIPVFLCLKLIFERRPETAPVVKTGSYLLGGLVLGLYFFFFLKDFNMGSITRYIAINLALYLSFLFIPYYGGRRGMELYIIRLMSRFFITVIYAAVLFLGTAAILFTIDKLLGIRIEGKIYFDLWLGVVGIFSPGFFLAGVPFYDETVEADSYPKLLKVLLLYIVMPIASVYTAILYIYFAKILVTLQWPMGLVAHLVLWYSVLVAILIFLISPLKEESRWVRSFTFLLPKVGIPLLLMLFVSVGIRVRAYGITENRYYVILLALWVLGIMMYYNLIKDRKNTVLFISLGLIAFLSVIGPWSSYSVGVFSQNQRLEGLLEKNHMLSGRAIVSAAGEVSAEDKKEISGILEYFSQNHSFEEARYLPKGFKMTQMKTVFGFVQTSGIRENTERSYFYYHTEMINRPMDIRGYSYLITSAGYPSPGLGSEGDYEVKYDNTTQEARVLYQGKEIYRKSLQEFGRQMYDKFGTDMKSDIDPNEMMLTDENENIKIKLIFSRIEGHEDMKNRDIHIDYMYFYVLIGLK
jgi:hypothetical protein